MSLLVALLIYKESAGESRISCLPADSTHTLQSLLKLTQAKVPVLFIKSTKLRQNIRCIFSKHYDIVLW